MGTWLQPTMEIGHGAAPLLLTLLLLVDFTLSYRLENDMGPMSKRGLNDPNDPKNLFNAMYLNNYKRGLSDPQDPRSLFANIYGYRKRNEEDSLTPGAYQLLNHLAHKRGLRDPSDPRNLFRAIYGYRR